MEELKTKRKYICTTRCQKRDDDGSNVIRFYEPGDPGWFVEPPERHFSPAEAIGRTAIDFEKVSEGVLLQDDIIPLEDIIKYIEATYSVSMAGYPRRQVVDYLIRSRMMPTEALSDIGGQAPTAQEFKSNDSEASSIGIEFSDVEEGLAADTPEMAIDTEADGSESADELSDLLNT